MNKILRKGLQIFFFLSFFSKILTVFMSSMLLNRKLYVTLSNLNWWFFFHSSTQYFRNFSSYSINIWDGLFNHAINILFSFSVKISLNLIINALIQYFSCQATQIQTSFMSIKIQKTSRNNQILFYFLHLSVIVYCIVQSKRKWYCAQMYKCGKKPL